MLNDLLELEAELESLEKQLCYKKAVVSDDRLLSLFDSAPEGPIELDTSLIYGPSDHTINETYSDKYKVVVPHDMSRPEGEKPREEITRGEEEMLECTFAPQTGRPPRNGPYAQLGNFPIEERLFHQASSRRRRETTDRILREREESLRAACTFHPTLITHPERHIKVPYRPPQDRLYNEWRHKEQVLAQATARADADATFTPAIDPLSRKLAMEAKEKSSCRDRENVDHPVAQSSLLPPFKPTLNPQSQRILELSDTLPFDFHRRQALFEKRRHAHFRALSDQVQENIGPFRPVLSGTADLVLALAKEKGEPSRELALHPRTSRWEENEFTFKPALNHRSLQLAEHNRRSVMEPRNDECKHSEVDRELEECTFKPNTHKPRVFGYEQPKPKSRLSIAKALEEGGMDHLGVQIERYRQERDRTIEEMKRQEEQKELKECTFRPKTLKNPPAHHGRSVSVAGLDRFLEKKALAEKQQAEREARQAKVFCLHPRSPRRRGPTVPQPFHLSGDRDKSANPC